MTRTVKSYPQPSAAARPSVALPPAPSEAPATDPYLDQVRKLVDSE